MAGEGGVRRLDRQIVRFGVGTLEEAGALAAQAGIHRALLVTDHAMDRTPWPVEVLRSLREAGVEATVYQEVSSPPALATVLEAKEALERRGADGVVSVGGGSVHDVAKVAAALVGSGATFEALAHEGREPSGSLPHVAVGTTAGTGAERSSYAFVIQEHGHEHRVLHHPLLAPDVAIIDPRTHTTLSPRRTAAAGLSALGRGVEAFLSRAHTPSSDASALVAVSGIHGHLVRAVEQGDDLEARTAVASAADRAAQAFEVAGLGLMDSIGLVLSGLFSIDHNTANAVVLPHVMRYEAGSLGSRAEALCLALGLDPVGDEAAQSRACVQAVRDLQSQVGLWQSLRDLGLAWDDLYLIRNSILRHPFSARDPRVLDEEGLAQVFLDALQGQPMARSQP